MINNRTDFMNEIADFYGKKIPASYIKRVDYILDKYSFGNDKLFSLFDEVTYIHDKSTLPAVNAYEKAIHSILNIDLRPKSKGLLTTTHNLTENEIVQQYINIQAKENKTMYDIDFLCDWDFLFYAYTFLKEKNWHDDQVYSYIKKAGIKNKIIAGEKTILSDNIIEEPPRIGEMSKFQDLDILEKQHAIQREKI